MSQQQYPEQIDCIWIASDQLECVAAFITAGQAPIPVEALASDHMEITDIEPRIGNLPVSSVANVLVKVVRPDSYIALAERGFFVFDWTYKHKAVDGRLGTYQLVAKPENFIVSTSLPDDLKKLASDVAFANIEFSNVVHVNVRLEKECAESVLSAAPDS